MVESRLEVWARQARDGLFGALYIMAKDTTQPNWFAAVSMALNFFQLLQFPLSRDPAMPWAKRQHTGIPAVSKGLQYSVTSTLPFSDAQWYVVLFVGTVLWSSLLLGLVASVALRVMHKQPQSILALRILRAVAFWSATNLFLPFTNVLVSALACSSGSTWHGTRTECFGAAYLFIAALSVTLIVAFLGICTLVTSVFFENSLCGGSINARVTARVDVIVLFCKFTAAISFHGPQQYIPPPLMGVSMIFYSSVWMWMYLRITPFIRPWINEVHVAQGGMFLWASLWLFVAAVTETLDVGIVLLVGMPVIGLATLMAARYRICKLTQCSLSEIKDCDQCELWARCHVVRALTGTGLSSSTGAASYGAAVSDPATEKRRQRLFAEAESAYNLLIRWLVMSKHTRMESHSTPYLTLADAYSRVAVFFRTTKKRYFPEMNMLHLAHKSAISVIDLDILFFVYQRTRQLNESQGGSGADGIAGLTAIERVMYEQSWSTIAAKHLTYYRAQTKFYSALLDGPSQANTIAKYGHKMWYARDAISSEFIRLQDLAGTSVKVLVALASFQREILCDVHKAAATLAEAERIETKANARNAHSVTLKALEFGVSVDVLTEKDDEYAVFVLNGDSEQFCMVLTANSHAAVLFGTAESNMVGRTFVDLFCHPVGGWVVEQLGQYATSGDCLLAAPKLLPVMTRGNGLQMGLVQVRERLPDKPGGPPLLTAVIKPINIASTDSLLIFQRWEENANVEYPIQGVSANLRNCFSSSTNTQFDPLDLRFLFDPMRLFTPTGDLATTRNPRIVMDFHEYVIVAKERDPVLLPGCEPFFYLRLMKRKRMSRMVDKVLTANVFQFYHAASNRGSFVSKRSAGSSSTKPRPLLPLPASPAQGFSASSTPTSLPGIVIHSGMAPPDSESRSPPKLMGSNPGSQPQRSRSVSEGACPCGDQEHSHPVLTQPPVVPQTTSLGSQLPTVHAQIRGRRHSAGSVAFSDIASVLHIPAHDSLSDTDTDSSASRRSRADSDSDASSTLQSNSATAKHSERQNTHRKGEDASPRQDVVVHVVSPTKRRESALSKRSSLIQEEATARRQSHLSHLVNKQRLDWKKGQAAVAAGRSILKNNKQAFLPHLRVMVRSVVAVMVLMFFALIVIPVIQRQHNSYVWSQVNGPLQAHDLALAIEYGFTDVMTSHWCNSGREVFCGINTSNTTIAQRVSSVLHAADVVDGRGSGDFVAEAMMTTVLLSNTKASGGVEVLKVRLKEAVQWWIVRMQAAVKAVASNTTALSMSTVGVNDVVNNTVSVILPALHDVVTKSSHDVAAYVKHSDWSILTAYVVVYVVILALMLVNIVTGVRTLSHIRSRTLVALLNIPTALLMKLKQSADRQYLNRTAKMLSKVEEEDDTTNQTEAAIIDDVISDIVQKGRQMDNNVPASLFLTLSVRFSLQHAGKVLLPLLVIASGLGVMCWLGELMSATMLEAGTGIQLARQMQSDAVTLTHAVVMRELDFKQYSMLLLTGALAMAKGFDSKSGVHFSGTNSFPGQFSRNLMSIDDLLSPELTQNFTVATNGYTSGSLMSLYSLMDKLAFHANDSCCSRLTDTTAMSPAPVLQLYRLENPWHRLLLDALSRRIEASHTTIIRNLENVLTYLSLGFLACVFAFFGMVYIPMVRQAGEDVALTQAVLLIFPDVMLHQVPSLYREIRHIIGRNDANSNAKPGTPVFQPKPSKVVPLRDFPSREVPPDTKDN